MAKILGHDVVMTSELQDAEQRNLQVISELKDIVQGQQTLIGKYIDLVTKLKRHLYTSLVVLAGTNLIALLLAISK